jgi:RNA polymerase sigma factor (sigma-70 family)
MQELDDSALLGEYAEHRSEQAFATLVTRHVDKVYSAALRHTRNPGHAEEITQAVFVILARKAPGLPRGTVLSGWLYQTARLASVTFQRSEIRRARREEEAHMQSRLHQSADDPAWKQLAPLLDDAMAALGARDRDAVVLRFFDGKSLREVSTAMSASEDATKKRVQRAVEKLRRFFTRRGVTLSAAVIAGVLSTSSAHAAPAHLAGSVSAGALGMSAAGASTLTLVKGVLKLMAWMKAKTALAVGAVALLAAGTTTVAVKVLGAPSLPLIQSTRAIPEWGDVIDPDGDCRFDLADGRLTIVVPGTDHVVMPERGKMNAPRVLRMVTGDFEAQVKVSLEFPTGAASVAPGRNPYQDAGLLLWVDDKTHLKLAGCQQSNGRQTVRALNYEWRVDGKYFGKPVTAPGNQQARTGYLRLQRRGDTIVGGVSPDGVLWFDLPPASLKLPRTVRIGVEAQHNTSTALTATFEELTVAAAQK